MRAEKVKITCAILHSGFMSQKTGSILTLTARPRGPFVELEGSYTIVEVHRGNRAAGEACIPIKSSNNRHVLTENEVWLPEFTEVKSLVRVCGLPGVDHRLRLAKPKVELVIRCEPIN